MKKILLTRINIETVWRSLHPVNYRPPYTLKYIQALLKTGGETETCFIDAYAQRLSFKKLIRLTSGFDPDILIVSSTPLDFFETHGYINAIKERKPEIITIIVGPGPSSLPDLYNRLAQADFILRGESELETYTIIEKAGQTKDILGLKRQYSENVNNGPLLVESLDALPFIDYTEKEIKDYGMLYPIRTNRHLRWGHILSSRGCPHECLFCSPLTRDSYGKKVRLRSAENILNEINNQLKRGINIISFDDDNPMTSRNHISSICTEILNRKLDFLWIAHARVDNLDREVMGLMRKAGCILLRIGIESGSERIINVLRKTNEINWSGKAREVFNAARDLGIATAALFIIGSPTETQEEILQSIRLANILNPDILQVSFFTPFPGSDIYRNNQYNFSPQDLKITYHYSDCRLINFSKVNDRELARLHKLFYLSFIFNKKLISKHFFQYFGFYICNIKVFFRLFRIIKYLCLNPTKRKTERNSNERPFY